MQRFEFESLPAHNPGNNENCRLWMRLTCEKVFFLLEEAGVVNKLVALFIEPCM
jgi:hypothetical protein